MKTDFDLNSI